MSRAVVVFHPAVEDDIAAIQAHYEQMDPVLPDRFEARLDDQVERLSMFPDALVCHGLSCLRRRRSLGRRAARAR